MILLTARVETNGATAMRSGVHRPSLLYSHEQVPVFHQAVPDYAIALRHRPASSVRYCIFATMAPGCAIGAGLAFNSLPRVLGEKRPVPTSRQLTRSKHRKLTSKPVKPARASVSDLAANRLNKHLFRTRFLHTDPATGQMSGCVRGCCSRQSCLMTLAGCSGPEDTAPCKFEDFMTRVAATRKDIYEQQSQDGSRDKLLDLLKKNWQPIYADVSEDAELDLDADDQQAGIQLYVWEGKKVSKYTLPLSRPPPADAPASRIRPHGARSD